MQSQSHNFKNWEISELARGKNISLSEDACWQLLGLQPNLQKIRLLFLHAIGLQGTFR